MKPRTLPVKRRPVSNGFFKRIHAVTRNRNQRVAATATAEDLESHDQSSRISRGFTIIFLIHVVAIALYFIHLNFLNGHSVAQNVLPATTEVAASPKPQSDTPALIPPGAMTCIVVAGDNYARVASREGVDEDALRAANKNKPIAAGRTLILPPKRIVAVDSPAVEALRKQNPSDANRGLVEPVPVLVRPKIVRDSAATKTTTHETSATAKTTSKTAGDTTATAKTTSKTAGDTTAAAKTTSKTAGDTTATAKTTKPKPGHEVAGSKARRESAAPKATPVVAPKASPVAAPKGRYVVKSGDNVYRIAKRFKVDQAALMRANGISDPAKLTSGTTLVIPH